MRSEATGPWVQNEGFDVVGKISLFDFARSNPLSPVKFSQKMRQYTFTSTIFIETKKQQSCTMKLK